MIYIKDEEKTYFVQCYTAEDRDLLISGRQFGTNLQFQSDEIALRAKRFLDNAVDSDVSSVHVEEIERHAINGG